MAFKKPKQPEEITSRDKKVIFDPITHSYYYKGVRLVSVTQFIKEFTKPFDPLFPSIKKAQKNTKDKTGLKDPVLLRKSWRLQAERKSNLGTSVHAFAELYIIDRSTEPINGYEKAVIKAFAKLEKKWEIISQEDIVYSSDYMLAGSIDLILRNKKTREYAVGDWKVTEDMNKSYGKLLDVYNTLKDSALNKYSIQLDIYSTLAPYRIPEENRIIIKLEKNGSFSLFSPLEKSSEYKLPFTLDKTKKALNQRKSIVKPLK